MKVFLCGLNEKVCKGKGRKILKKRKKELFILFLGTCYYVFVAKCLKFMYYLEIYIVFVAKF